MPSTVEEDRRHLVEASIVRVMKARKRLSHNDLVAEISRQLAHRFIPSPQVKIFLLLFFSPSFSLFCLSLSLSLFLYLADINSAYVFIHCFLVVYLELYTSLHCFLPSHLKFQDLVTNRDHFSFLFFLFFQFIKKRVESLIERDYLQRDKEDRRF